MKLAKFGIGNRSFPVPERELNFLAWRTGSMLPVQEFNPVHMRGTREAWLCESPESVTAANMNIRQNYSKTFFFTLCVPHKTTPKLLFQMVVDFQKLLSVTCALSWLIINATGFRGDVKPSLNQQMAMRGCENYGYVNWIHPSGQNIKNLGECTFVAGPQQFATRTPPAKGADRTTNIVTRHDDGFISGRPAGPCARG